MAVIDSAATLLRDARRRAGMTQVEVGRRAGVTQSVVSAYESGQRQPSLPVLLALIAATGHALDADLVPAPSVPRPLSGRLGRRVHRHRHRIKEIAAAHGAGNVRIFGSVARGDERPDSDVDLLLDLPEGVGLFTLGRLRQDLEELLTAPVDVIPADGLKADVRASIEADLVIL
ncbi:hypothetical protein NUM3379_22600 [Kineococcus sp. NUM-3379]